MNPNLKRLTNGIFVLKDDTHLSRWVEESGRLDHAHEFLEQFKRFIPEGATVIDCGACIGDHTVTYASYVGPRGKVIGFEANSDSADCAALNLAIYPWAQVYNVGLSDSFGVSGIDRSPNVGASCLTPDKGREVHLAPLDEYTYDLKRLDFIKVDIEGFEAKMLKGSDKTLRKFRPTLLMEVNRPCLEKYGSSKDEIYSILKGYGYRIQVVDGKEDSNQYEILCRK